jgi:hypothetical protein
MVPILVEHASCGAGKYPAPKQPFGLTMRELTLRSRLSLGLLGPHPDYELQRQTGVDGS